MTELDILASFHNGHGNLYVVEGGPNYKMVVWDALTKLEASGEYVKYNGKKGVITQVDWEPNGEMTFVLDEEIKGRASWKDQLLQMANIPNVNGSSTSTATVPIGGVTGTATIPYGTGQTSYGTTGTAIVANGGAGILGQNYMITTGGSITSSGVVGYTISKPQSDSPDLPEICMTADDGGRKVEITLAPDSHLSAQEALKIMMLLMASATEPESFNALNYIKKNNLERHFKYA